MKGFNKKRNNLFLGFAVMFLAAIFSFTLLGCKTDDDGDDGGGGVPSELIGKWTTVEGNSALVFFEFTSDGKCKLGTTYDVSVSGKTVDLKSYGSSVGTFTYSISVKVMTLTDATGVFALMEGQKLYKL